MSSSAKTIQNATSTTVQKCEKEEQEVQNSQHPEQALKTKNKIKCVFYMKELQLLKTHFQKHKSVTLKMGHGHRNLSLIEVTGHCHTLSKKSLKVKQQLRKCLYEFLSLCQSRIFVTNPYSLSLMLAFTLMDPSELLL